MYGATSRAARRHSRRETAAAEKSDKGEITLELAEADQLFEDLDAAPFGRRLLTPHAERYIVELARQAPASCPILIEVRLPRDNASGKRSRHFSEEIRRFFRYRAEQCSRELRDLFQEGRKALMIGVPILIVCLLLSQYIKQHVEEQTLAHLVGESLLIPGWVANWKPLEIFLYAWWPVRGRRKLYERLAAAEVHLRKV